MILGLTVKNYEEYKLENKGAFYGKNSLLYLWFWKYV